MPDQRVEQLAIRRYLTLLRVKPRLMCRPTLTRPGINCPDYCVAYQGYYEWIEHTLYNRMEKNVGRLSGRNVEETWKRISRLGTCEQMKHSHLNDIFVDIEFRQEPLPSNNKQNEFVSATLEILNRIASNDSDEDKTYVVSPRDKEILRRHVNRICFDRLGSASDWHSNINTATGSVNEFGVLECLRRKVNKKYSVRTSLLVDAVGPGNSMVTFGGYGYITEVHNWKNLTTELAASQFSRLIIISGSSAIWAKETGWEVFENMGEHL